MANTRQAKSNKSNRIAIGVLIIIVSLFCFLSLVGALGGVGKMVYGFLAGFFGLAAYAYSLMGLIGGIAITFNVRPRMRASRFFVYFGLLLIGVLALQVYTSSAHIVNADYGTYLVLCYENTNTAGGMMLGIVAYPLMKAITSVGALVVVCAAFFVLALFAILPSIKRNVTYNVATKSERDRAVKQKRAPLFAKKSREADGHPIDAPDAPVLTDLSQPSNKGGNLFVVDVDGDPLQKKSRKIKGADGYNPLYPNAMGGIEDDIVSARAEYVDKYSARRLAKDILLGAGPNEENLSKFNTITNPNEALSSVGAPYNALKRNELRNKLGIDTAQNAIKEDFMARYRADGAPVSDARASMTTDTRTSLPSNDGFGGQTPVGGSTVDGVRRDSEVLDFKKDFNTLKQEQLQRFSEMYSNVKPEFEATAYSTPKDNDGVRAETVKKEVAKPSRVIPRPGAEINQTVSKAESAVAQQSVTAGMQGAVNRALSNSELPKPRQKEEIVAEAYDVPVADKTRAVQQSDSLGTPIQKSTNTPKMPRAFAATALTDEEKARIESEEKSFFSATPNATRNVTDAPATTQRGYSQNQSGYPQNQNGYTQRQTDGRGDGVNAQSRGTTPSARPSYEMSKATLQPDKARYVDGGSTAMGEVPSAPAPIQTNVTSGDMSRAAIQSATAIAKQSPKEIEAAEMKARIENIKQARKEAPPLSAFEQAEKLKEEKMRAAQNRGMQKATQTAKKLDSFAEEKGRVSQVTMEQAISQVTPKRPYAAPPMNLLDPPVPEVSQNEDYETKKAALIRTLGSFGITAEVISIKVGPTFSMYTLKVEMPRGKTINFISSLENDVAMQMEEESVRIIAPIPGKNAVGIEVPNKHRRIVRLSEIIGSPVFNQSKSPATFALGTNLYGENYAIDVRSLPHALIAGATGAGKSCCINSIIISLLYKASPDDVRFIMVDPKRVELSIYAGIPHLLMDEIICDTDKAIRALNWAITEMNRRIQYLSDVKFRDIDEYNADCEKHGYEKMPRIIIVVDEFADLMSMGKKAVEDSINRIARLARAVGIHLLLATQRPSVDVVSGTIKNNLPSRVAFKVTSSFDSKTILDSVGAEKLLGNGDLLYMTPKSATLERMQGAFISNEEVKRVVDYVKEHNDSYFDNKIKDAIFNEKEEDKSEGGSKSRKNAGGVPSELFDALRMGIELNGPITISNMQRRLGLGWPKAAKIYDMMDDMGYLSQDENDAKKKRVNITAEELDEIIRESEGEGSEE